MTNNYTYAAAYVKSLKRPRDTDVDAISASGNMEEIKKILKGFGYEGESIAEMAQNERQRTWEICRELCGGSADMEALMKQLDFYNIRAAFKAGILGADAGEFIIKPCRVDIEAIANVNFSGQEYEDILKDSYSIYKKYGMCIADSYLARMGLEEMNKKCEGGFMRGFCRIKLENASLNVVLRLQNQTTEILELCLPESGIKSVLSNAEKSAEERLKSEGYGEAFELFKRSKPEFEEYLKDRVLDYVKSAEMSFFEFDAVLAYFIEKTEEIKKVQKTVYESLLKGEDIYA